MTPTSNDAVSHLLDRAVREKQGRVGGVLNALALVAFLQVLHLPQSNEAVLRVKTRVSAFFSPLTALLTAWNVDI